MRRKFDLKVNIYSKIDGEDTCVAAWVYGRMASNNCENAATDKTAAKLCREQQMKFFKMTKKCCQEYQDRTPAVWRDGPHYIK